MTLPAGEAATLEINDYGLVVNSPGIATLTFESGSADVITPPDISITNASGSNPTAEWYGDDFLDFFASSGIGPDEFGRQYLGTISTDAIVARFPATVNVVGAWFQSMGPTQAIVFFLYDENDQALFTQFLQAPGALDQLYYYGVYSEQPIGRAVWLPAVSFGVSPLRIDNLTYGTITSPVPGPAAAWLLGTGIFGLVGRRHLMKRQLRRHNQAASGR